MGWFSGVKVKRGVTAASAAFDAGDYQKAISLGQDAAALARQNRRFADETLVLLVLHRAHGTLGDLTAARQALDAARDAANRDSSDIRPLLTWHVEHAQAILHDTTFEPQAAMAAYERAVEALDHAHQIPGVQLFGGTRALAHYRRQTLLGIADLLGRGGRIGEALTRNADVVNSASTDRDGPVLVAALADRSWLLRIVNDDDEAANVIGKAADSLAELDFSTTHRSAVLTIMTRIGLEVARLQAIAGNREGLDEGFAQAREMVEQAGAADLLSEVLATETEVALLLGRNEHALAVARTLQGVKGTTGVVRLRSLQSQALALAANERYDEAYTCFAELLPRCDEAGQPVTAVHMSLLAARVTAKLGRTGEAIGQLRHAVRGYGTISAAVGTATTRDRLLTGDADERAECFAVAAAGTADRVPEAGLAAIEVAETWREDTLAGTLRANHENLPADVHDLVTRVDALRAAIAQPPSAASLGDSFDPRVHGESRLQSQLDELRDQLAHMVGEGFARGYVPTPVSAEEIRTACGDRALVSITPTEGEHDGLVAGYTVWAIPGEQPRIRRFQLSTAASTLVRELHTGRPDHDTFPAAWQDVRDELADLLLPAKFRAWLTSRSAEVVACADGVLRNLPIAALPVADRTVLADCAIVNRLPLLRLAGRSPHETEPNGPLRVLGVFEPGLGGAVGERATLRELHDLGRVTLTEVTGPTPLITALTEHQFDLLVLSTHGSGAGLDYRFHLPDGDLAVASLLRMRVPATVVAAACYSGTDGGADATGALALLLSSGAREVLTGSWSLPDGRTGTLLSEVYRTLDGTTALPELITRAQREAHLRLSAANPLSWAGLVATSMR
jgi:tetratricopeptide (TPR) repeat protein